MTKRMSLAVCFLVAFAIAMISPAVVTLFSTQKIDLALLIPTTPGLAVALVALAAVAFTLTFTSARTARRIGKPLAFLANVAGGAIVLATAMWTITYAYAAAFTFDSGAMLVLNVSSTIWAPAIGSSVVLAAIAACTGIRFGDTAFAATEATDQSGAPIGVLARIQALIPRGFRHASASAAI